MNPQKVVEIAIQAVKRELPGFPTQSGWCVAFAFECIARAYNTNRWLLYAKLLDSVKADPDRSRWANDVELAVERLGWAVTRQDFDPANAVQRSKLLQLLKPGDLLFSSKLFDESPASTRTAQDREGHIGIYIGTQFDGSHLVAENTRAARGRYFGSRSALRLTPLGQWDTVTTVARIPSTWKP